MKTYTTEHWLGLTPQEASEMLFKLILDKFLQDKGYDITACPNIRILTQRLYGDYRQVRMTAEYKRAEKHNKWWRNCPLRKALD
jgi:hypothetical protein